MLLLGTFDMVRFNGAATLITHVFRAESPCPACLLPTHMDDALLNSVEDDTDKHDRHSQ